jgi:hypothetical protein
VNKNRHPQKAIQRTSAKAKAALTASLVAAALGFSAVAASPAHASDTIYISCDLSAHVCLQVVRLDDGTRVGTKYGYDNNGNYWEIETGLVS